MAERSSSQFSLSMLNLAGYFIVPAVAIPMLAELFRNDAPGRWLASGLLALFTLFYAGRERVLKAAPWGAYLYTSVQTLVVVALLAIPPHQLIVVVLFFVLSSEVTMMYPPRVIAGWLTLFSLITLVAYVRVGGSDAAAAVPIYVAGYIFFAIFAHQTARAENARAESERLLLELQAAHRQLQDYAAQAEELAVQQERNRLAREMHDTLGHRLTVSSVQLQAAQRLIPSAPERAGQMVGAVLEEIRAGLGELRRTVATLRTPVEADLALGPALKRLTDDFQRATGIAIQLSVADDLPELTASQRHALYRGAQEGLTNIQKHAGAGAAWIDLICVDGTVALRVRDDGLGLAANAGDQTGFGLPGLYERATQLGGQLTVGSAPAGGVELLMTLPLAPEQSHG
ncbi:MAG TPA: sensor histidine kinase [Anaerolineae bacterium]|nr:sensor histidine kinase [Anaerolineae bacterium]